MSWWVTVDGVRLPRQVSGHPALELVNTRAGWGEPYDAERQDYLRSYHHLVVLAAREALVTGPVAERLQRHATREPERAQAEVARARRLRTDLHGLLVGDVGQAARARLTGAIAQARARQRLDLSAPPRWTFGGVARLADPLDSFLVAAGELLVADPRISGCPGHGCGWLFLNPSGRRRWCQMAVCGNRAKQTAHAHRRRT